MKYRIIVEIECESDKLLDELCIDVDESAFLLPLQKVTKVRVTGEELEYKDVKII